MQRSAWYTLADRLRHNSATRWALCVLAGVLVGLNAGYAIAGLLCTVLALLLRRQPSLRTYPLLLLLALILTRLAIAQQQQHWPPVSLAGQTITLQGRIDSLVEQRGDRLRFNLRISHTTANWPSGTGARLRVSWYHPKQQPHAGESWQLNLRLKPPHGSRNPGSFDYGRWLFGQGLHGTAYVVGHANNTRLAHTSPWSLPQLRERMNTALSRHLDGHPAFGLVQALVTGDRSAITPLHMQALRHTGTVHLLAISGLHIGLIGGLAYAVTFFLWGSLPGAAHFCPSQRIASIVALLAATSYALLAGWTIPTQRAMLMMAVLLISRYWLRPPSWLHSFSMALLLVLLAFPLSVLQAGFWLSFVAVLFLLQHIRQHPQLPKWQLTLRLQLVITAALLPWLLHAGITPALLAPLANLFAIPWVAMLSAPLLLAGVLSLPFPTLADWLLQRAADSLDWLLRALHSLATYAPDYTLSSPASLGMALLASGGLYYALDHRHKPRKRAIALLLFLPLFWPQHAPDMPPGAVRIDLLDVGQGLASVVRTQHHTLIFDTGPRWRHFDTGKSILLPFLRQAGIRYIDTLIISHADNDHRGGGEALLHALPIARLLSAVPDVLSRPAEPCRAGMRWRWDGVDFILLGPSPNTSHDDNNRSCVLLLRTTQHSALLPGDVEQPGEQAMMAALPSTPLDLLIAPHHGSATSSSADWLQRLQPRVVWFATGYLNRYHFPHREVVARYARYSQQRYSTACDGQLSLLLPATAPLPKTQTYNRKNPAPWLAGCRDRP